MTLERNIHEHDSDATESAYRLFQMGTSTSGIEFVAPIPLSVISERPDPLRSYFETDFHVELAHVDTNGTAISVNAAEIEGISQPSAESQLQSTSLELAKQLASIRELPENWDHAGARKILNSTVEKASYLAVRAFHSNPAASTGLFIAPRADGGITLEWIMPWHKELIVTAHADSSLETYLLVLRADSDNELEIVGEIDELGRFDELINELFVHGNTVYEFTQQ